MRVVVTIQHPAHVHVFRHAIDELEARGHEVRVFAREKEVVVDLLVDHGIDHEVLAGSAGSLPSLARVQATYELRLLRRARRFDPDVIAAVGGVAATHVASLLGAKSVVFYDTEHAALIKRLAYPFADVICTPDCYAEPVAGTHHSYPGYHELAYLHPDRFSPDSAALSPLGVDPTDRFVVVRTVDWGASHDVGHGGFEGIHEVVARLEDRGARVFLSAEGSLPPDLESHRLSTPPGSIHDVLAFADCFVGEGATMAAESAVLGTPAVYVNSLELGYLSELEFDYGLVFGHGGPDRHERALSTAEVILDEADDEKWERRRTALLSEKVDVTDVLVREIESLGRAEPEREVLA